MSIVFFLTPKEEVAYIYEDNDLGQTLEKMEIHRYTAIPVLKRTGEYLGTMTEGDLLWAIKNQYQMDFRTAMQAPLSDLPRHSDNLAVKISMDIDDIITKSLDQNFVPVVDDRGMFIGIVTRRHIIQYYKDKLEQRGHEAAQKDVDEIVLQHRSLRK
ncbi:MAG: CBS domain-containing protein [Clostridiales bacterium]|nr:CBS domain-containing protein [Clostridiales bacterium]